MFPARSSEHVGPLHPEKYLRFYGSAITDMTTHTKKTVALQGRTIPNCLHLIDTLDQTNLVKPIKLVSFLNAQRNKISKNIKISYSGLQST